MDLLTKFSKTNLASFLLALLLIAGPAHAVGPVPAETVPGGATIVDDGDVSGETWGRAGGRTISYDFNTPEALDSLTWRPGSVGMAFDGEINAGLEIMGSETLTAGNTVLQWYGETQVELAVPPYSHIIETRFTLTVSGPAMIMTGPYEVDLLDNGGYLEINIIFEARVQGDVSWTPALDLYDSMDTLPPPAGDGLAITSFNSGFHFEEAAGGLSLTEHDANMHARASELLGILQFLQIEVPGRAISLGEQIGLNADKLMLIQSDLQTLLGASNDGLATSEDIQGLNMALQGLESELSGLMQGNQNLIVCMWVGFNCPPEATQLGAPSLLGIAASIGDLSADVDWAKMDIATLSASIATSFGAVDAKLDQLAVDLVANMPRTLQLQGVKSPRTSKSDASLLVLATLGGVGVDATITSVEAVSDNGNGGMESAPLLFDTSQLTEPGLHQLAVELPRDQSSVRMLVVRAEVTAAGGEVVKAALLLSEW